MFKLHILALLLGTILDVLVGPLYSVWNPFDSVKKWIKFLDRALLGDEIILLEPSKQEHLGIWAIALVLSPVIVFVSFFNMLCYDISPFLGVIFEALATYFCLEGNRTFYLGRNVMESYYSDGMDSMNKAYEILTREEEVSSASEKVLTEKTVTVIANEAGDSVISPLVVMFFLGPVGGFIYRSLDLLDRQIAHKNQRYQHFGFYVAKLNQIIDYLPSRFSGLLAVFAARHTFGDFNGKNARYIHLRDRFKAVSAFSGAIGIKLKDGTIGDEDKVPEPKDIRRATSLMANMFFTCQILLFILLILS